MRNRMWMAARAAMMVVAAIGLVSCGSSSTPAEDAANERAIPSETGSVPPKGPDMYRANFETTAGNFVIEVHRDWAPLGADRFHELIETHFLDGGGFFRVVPGFVVQFGLSPDPKANEQWGEKRLADDPVKASNARGTITFATAGANTRTTQLFINYADNSRLDGAGFSPFGVVVEGMDVVDKIYSGYGEAPDQTQIELRGDAYLKQQFPKLDFIKKVTITEAGAASE